VQPLCAVDGEGALKERAGGGAAWLIAVVWPPLSAAAMARRSGTRPTKLGVAEKGMREPGGSGAPFGFTGELHHNDLVYLRARWYDPSTGTLLGRDPFAGYDTLPYWARQGLSARHIRAGQTGTRKKGADTQPARRAAPFGAR